MNDTWARRKALKSRQRTNFVNLDAATLTSVNILENFMISKFPAHGTGCLVTSNFFASQRPAVILSENEIQTPADRTISKVFQNTSFMIKKIKVKVRNRTDCTTAFRRAIAPVDDITLRVQPLYESCE